MHRSRYCQNAHKKRSIHITANCITTHVSH